MAQDGGTHLVAIVSRKLTSTELKGAPIERLLSLAAWATRKLQRFTAFAIRLDIFLPSPAEVLLLKVKEFPPRLQALLLELSLYRVDWKVG